MTAVLTSASGLLALLDEPDDALQHHALASLDSIVDKYWPEIATVIPKIEALVEDETFQFRSLASHLASKIFFHLEELDEALRYALGAGKLFNISSTNEYVNTIIAKCIDEYIRLRVEAYDAAARRASTAASSDEKSFSDIVVNDAEVGIDSRLVDIVERMFARCIENKEYTQALGIAIESRRLDSVQKVISASNDITELLSYCFTLSHSIILPHSFRSRLLKLLVELYSHLPTPDYAQVAQCHHLLGNATAVADLLSILLVKGNDYTLLAYQIAFDLNENQNQSFMNEVAKALPPPKNEEKKETTASVTTDGSSTDTTSTTANNTSATSMDVSEDSVSAPETNSEFTNSLNKLHSILSGEALTTLNLRFLFEHNATDINILRLIKDKLEARNTVIHNAAVICHGFMHCGTTIDTFLRDNLEWLSRAQNWAKFTATASIGVIHRGHVKESLRILEPYLPSNGASGSPYQEGGALYALGLIHSQHGQDKIAYLSEALRNAGTNEIVQHGACLGLGLCAMATHDMGIFESLKNVVMSESAVAGEAAGYAMGLVLIGSGSGEAVEEMLSYAHDTQHEKIIRGLAMGIAFIEYGREEEADVVIEQLMGDKDAILRYGGMYAIGLAYACTANNSAIRKLLHVAVSDVSDDVRRAAVTNLGLVLANVPDQVPRVVALLAESYNPHVRYGAALAVGIACAGGQRARSEAFATIEPLLKDRVDYVRQGAYIAFAMICMQHNEKSEPKLAILRKAIDDVMNVKSDTMTKLGAIIAAGIVDAGGRNTTISLLSSTGHKRMQAIVGMAMFPQFWYWYPLVHFLSLSFTPTAVIGLNKNLEIPEPFTFISNAPPSTFAYPPAIQLTKVEEKKTVKHATLSVTAKAKAKAKKKEEEKESSMDVETVAEKKSDPSAMDVESKDETAETKATTEADKTLTKPEPEPTTQELRNPARVTLSQQSVISYSSEQRYIPVKKSLTIGAILLRDTTPGEPEVMVQKKDPKVGVPGVGDDEPEPPQPFEYRG